MATKKIPTLQEQWAKQPITRHLGCDSYVGKTEMKSMTRKCNSGARK
jgi:hypothetical protein